MGWNKQSGESWELQRTMQRYGDDPQAKALALKITGFMTIEDADALMRALHDEIVAARMSEAKHPFEARQISYGSSVLQNWDEVLGEEPKPSFLGKMSEPVGEEEGCTDCE